MIRTTEIASPALNLSALIATFAMAALAPVQALHAAPARAYVDQNTVRTAGGDLLRGTSLHISGFTTRANPYGLSKSNLLILRDQGHLNCIRLCCLDPRAYADGRPERAMPISEETWYCDSIIKNCGELGIYVILNYHCMGHVTDGGEYDIRNFWRHYAPRYKDSTHVLYEIENEPHQGPPTGGASDWSLGLQVELYRIIRDAAPSAVILTGYEPVQCADNWGPWLKIYAEQAGFSWDSGLDVWPWHDYGGTTVQAVNSTKAEGIPMICSEFSYFEDGWYNTELEGCHIVAQWCERNDMSWIDWKTWSAEDQAMQLEWLIPDAESKGWSWWSDDDTPPPAPAGLAGSALDDSQIRLTWGEVTDPESGVRSYVVYRNGTQVASTAELEYTDEDLTESTSYQYQVAAVNGASLEGVKSSSVDVSTMADNTAPSVVSVAANGIATEVLVVFDEPIEQAGAQQAGNYTIDNGISVSGASLGSNLTTVTLTTTTLQRGTTYTLTVANIRDRASSPNTMSQASASFEFLNAITRVRFYPRASHTGRMTGGIFEGSNGDAEDGPYTVLHTIWAGPTDGQWTEVDIDNDISYRFMRYRAPANSFGNVAEIEFYRGTEKATGTLFGTPGSWENSGNDYTKVFDGLTATYWDYSEATSCYAGLDLGTANVGTLRDRAVQTAPRAMRINGNILHIPNGAYSLRVTDASGRAVHQASGMGPVRSDLSLARRGLHLIELTVAGRTLTKRIAVK